MDQFISEEQDLEAGIIAQESPSVNSVSGNAERVNFGVSEKIDDDDLNYPLMGNENPNSQSLDLSERKRNDIVKKDKKSRKASKPPRPPKGPSFTANDHKVMKEIAELAMRKRARIERMRNSLRRLKAAKSSSSPYSCISIFFVIVTVLFFGFLVFQGLFAGNMTMSSDNTPAPVGSPNNQLISVQFYNEFAPVEQTDPSPTTSYRYTRKRISGAEED
ncbi:unnamed protein product [Eruca vesicaria subsp. sativa]|uniref:Transmembrane protein n=1 Tax=Eruca vesicaria subsp. sativa TaxID=29727 RepID=A0ABC8K7A9_ERUVS|nr:unnamed protein product [Eruca vesicaria subsp. sativa]